MEDKEDETPPPPPEESPSPLNPVKLGIEEKDYESAVAHIQKFYKEFFCTVVHLIEISLTKKEEVDDVYIELIESVEEKLKHVIHSQLQKSLESNVLHDIARALQSGLGMKEESLKIFIERYVEELIKSERETVMQLFAAWLELQKETEAKKNKKYEELEAKEWKEEEETVDSEEDKLLDFVDALRRFCEFLAEILEGSSDFIVNFFGHEGLKAVGQVLLVACDEVAAPLLERYIEWMGLQQFVVRLNLQKMGELEGDPLDPRELTKLLGQMSLLSQCNELFDQFVKKKQVPFTPSFKRHSFIKEIMTYYNVLEEYFMTESSKKAIRLDSPPQGKAKTSSMVDNLFFVLKQCAQRALNTYNSNSACAIVSLMSNILSFDYKDVLSSMLTQSFDDNTTWNPRVSFSFIPSLLFFPNRKVVLNNVEVSVEYSLKLHTTLVKEAEKLYEFSKKDLEKLKTVLEDLKSVAREIETDLLLVFCFSVSPQPYIEEVCSRLLPRVAMIFEAVNFKGVGYEISEEKFQEYEVNDPFMEHFLLRFNDLVLQYKESFTENNLSHTLRGVLDYILSEFERMIFTRRFTLLGAFQLDKEVKMLMDYFTQNASKVRDKFSRINQMVSLLTQENAIDVLELWNGTASKIKWKISASEAKTLATRRVDFSKVQISQLTEGIR